MQGIFKYSSTFKKLFDVFMCTVPTDFKAFYFARLTLKYEPTRAIIALIFCWKSIFYCFYFKIIVKVSVCMVIQSFVWKKTYQNFLSVQWTSHKGNYLSAWHLVKKYVHISQQFFFVHWSLPVCVYSTTRFWS